MAKLSAADVSKILGHLPGCMGAPSENVNPCLKSDCLQCIAREALMSTPPAEGHSLTIGSLLSQRSHQGLVELIVNEERIQFTLEKAREVYQMFGGAIEAAVTDQIVYEVFRDKGVPENLVVRVLADLREKRQGSKGTVYAS